MRLIQYHLPGKGRRVGVVEDDIVYDLTSLNPRWDRVYHLFGEARRADTIIEEHVDAKLDRSRAGRLVYADLWNARPGDPAGWLLPPIDHPDPAHCMIGGTGLTHLGSMAQRAQMHKDTDQPKTDSQKMFEMGLEGGRPGPGTRGIAPECFYKGSGAILRGHHDTLDIPSFTQDGGEEPEIVACYIVGDDCTPYRIGFAQGNEWADHAVERVNYLWLAPSKLRNCAIGPELITDESFQDLRGRCRIYRGSEELYDSGELLTGEQNMSHSFANLEDHHFKYAQFRQPGDLHIYFFGTMKMSFDVRGPFEEGDRIEIHFPKMGAALENYVRRETPDATSIVVRKG